MVTTWTGRVLLMWWTMAASVVLFPEPVAPVTMTRPRRLSARSFTVEARPSSSKDRAPLGTARATIERRPCCRATFRRNRRPSSSEYPTSRSPLRSNRAFEVPISTLSRRVMSCCLVVGLTSMVFTLPCTRIAGCLPSQMYRSEASASTMCESRPIRSTSSLRFCTVTAPWYAGLLAIATHRLDALQY